MLLPFHKKKKEKEKNITIEKVTIVIAFGRKYCSWNKGEELLERDQCSVLDGLIVIFWGEMDELKSCFKVLILNSV